MSSSLWTVAVVSLVVLACFEARASDCAEPIEVTALPYTLTGSDFNEDFTDDHELFGTGCIRRSGTAEVVFQVELTAGQTLIVSEHGSLDAVLSILNTCSDIHLLPRVLDSASRFEGKPSDAEMERMVEEKRMSRFFVS